MLIPRRRRGLSVPLRRDRGTHRRSTWRRASRNGNAGPASRQAGGGQRRAARRKMQTRKAEHHGLPGRLFFLRGESVGQARHRQQRIRLLDDLVPLQAVETDLMVAGGVPLFERGGVHRLQQLEAIVGAQVASHWVPRDLDALFQRLPSRQFLLAEAERRKAVGVLPLHPPGGRQRQVKVMADHHIGEKVVAGDPAVFIRSLAEQQVETCAVRRRRIATAPETGRLDVDFLRLPGKRGISCDARVQVQRCLLYTSPSPRD